MGKGGGATTRGALVGHDIEAVILAHKAGLALAHGDCAHVLEAGDDRHPERCQGVAWQRLHVI